MPVPDDARERCERLIAAVRATEPDGRRTARWVRTDGLHLTLRFLGATPPAGVAAVESAMRQVAATGAPFEAVIGDGDHTDALLLIDEPTFPGCRVWARPIGGLEMRDDKGEDVKVRCVAEGDPNQAHIERLEQMRPHRLVEIEHFFNTYKLLEDKMVDVVGWRAPSTPRSRPSAGRPRTARTAPISRSPAPTRSRAPPAPRSPRRSRAWPPESGSRGRPARSSSSGA